MSQHLEYITATERYARCPRCGIDWNMNICGLHQHDFGANIQLGKCEIIWQDKRLGSDADKTIIKMRRGEQQVQCEKQAFNNALAYWLNVSSSAWKITEFDYLLPFDIDEERLEKLLVLI